MNTARELFQKRLKNPWQARLFMLSRLPAAFFSGVRLREIDDRTCRVSVPYKWFTKNPFRSTYFACLSMAAEMSTGALAMSYVYKKDPPVSLLVIKVESEYFKKVNGRGWFTCQDGGLFETAVEETVRLGEPRTVRARSTGKNDKGEIIAEFFITWSFKAKGNLKKA